MDRDDFELNLKTLKKVKLLQILQETFMEYNETTDEPEILSDIALDVAIMTEILKCIDPEDVVEFLINEGEPFDERMKEIVAAWLKSAARSSPHKREPKVGDIVSFKIFGTMHQGKIQDIVKVDGADPLYVIKDGESIFYVQELKD